MCGSRSSGSPTTATSRRSPAAARRRAMMAEDRAAWSARVAWVWRQASAAASAIATTGSTLVRPCSTSRTGPGRRHRVRSGTTSTPSPLGPPHDRASPARTSKCSGTGSRPRDAMASTSSGMPRAWQSPWAASRGWRVPISALADWTAASALPGTASACSRAARSTRPTRSTGTSANIDGSWAAAAWKRPVVRIAECSTAVATIRAPRRRPAYRRPSSPARSAAGPPGRNETSSGRTPSPWASTSRA